MVKIRLRRFGKKNTPVYRVVVADGRSPRDGRIIEEIGTYDPLLKNNNFTLNLDRVDYWLGVGAQASDTVNSFIKKARKGPVEVADEEPAAEAVEAPAETEAPPEPAEAAAKVAVAEEPAAEEATEPAAEEATEPAAEEATEPEAPAAPEASAPEEAPEPEAPAADEADAPKADN
jgi:small subunit ribosomal protein S16